MSKSDCLVESANIISIHSSVCVEFQYSANIRMILWRSLLLITLLIMEYPFIQAASTKGISIRYLSEYAGRVQIEKEEDIERWMIHNRKMTTNHHIRTQRGKWRFRDLDPIEDCHKVSALVMLAQRNVSSALQIPSELQQVIHEYSDLNEIRTLFEILTLSEDKKGILGFESYEAMHQKHPTRSSKVLHLANLRDDGEQCDNGYNEEDSWCDPRAVKFGQDNRFIIGINWTPIITVPIILMQCPPDFSHIPKAINWKAIGALKHLRYLRFGYLKLNVSMHDIKSLPDSVQSLDIAGCVWTEPSGDVDLSLLPSGLREFNGCECEGMTGLLKFAAPHSNLTVLRLAHTLIHDVSGLNDMPPSLKTLYLSGKRLNLTEADFNFLIDKLMWKTWDLEELYF